MSDIAKDITAILLAQLDDLATQNRHMLRDYVRQCTAQALIAAQELSAGSPTAERTLRHLEAQAVALAAEAGIAAREETLVTIGKIVGTVARAAALM